MSAMPSGPVRRMKRELAAKPVGVRPVKPTTSRLAGKPVQRGKQARPGAAVPVATLCAAGFLLALALAVMYYHLSPRLLWLYGGASVVAAILYARDKHAAIAGRRRIPENTLHLAALIGGWPGALAAQSQLRHKTLKHGFRIIFWLTVLLNCAALAVFLIYKDTIA